MKILWWLYTIYSAFIFVVIMLVLGPFIVIPLMLSPKGGKVSFVFIRLWALAWSFMVGIRYKVYGRELLHPAQPYIYIFNHRSFIDAPVIPIAIRQEIRAIGKKELSKIPVFGFIVSRFAVWVDRKDTQSRKASVDKLKKILESGVSIVVAPEGTRNDSNQPLLPFHLGAFRIALETGIPIMPIGIVGADSIMKRGSLLMKPGTISIYFGNPILPVGPYCESGYNSLSEKSFSQLSAILSIS
jgi:1-acyl-sn-glycerol-3-phosphate acyltransferase